MERSGRSTSLTRRNFTWVRIQIHFIVSFDRFLAEEGADIEAKEIHGIQGILSVDPMCNPEDTFLQLPGDFCEDIKNNFAISVTYNLPEFPPGFIFPAKILPGAKFPESRLKEKGNRSNRAPQVRNREKSDYSESSDSDSSDYYYSSDSDSYTSDSD